MSVVLHATAVLLLVLCVCVCVLPVAGDLDKVCTTEDRREGGVAGGYCGERINEMLDLTCAMFRRKRRLNGYQNIESK